MRYNIKKSMHLFTLLFLGLTMGACGQKTKTEQKINTSMEHTNKTSDKWKDKLTAEEYRILREKGTEYPFTGDLLHNKEKGTYTCAGCGNELFTDQMKFDSGTGWPSFDAEVAGGKIKKIVDQSHGMSRTEVVCANCEGHLGHLFDDGPTQTGLRYCVNSASLNFEPKDKKKEIKTIILGGGCFWCTEASFLELKGVKKVVSGYSGGLTKNPTYKEISTGTTGHAEVVEVTYDASVLSLEEILEVFFIVHDPTTPNRQGADVGSQYRSIIFYEDQSQKAIIEKVIKTLNNPDVFDGKIVTQVEPQVTFYKAEEYHQNYYNQNKNQSYCRIVIAPKIEKVQKVFKNKLK